MTPEHERKHILLVDDEPSVLEAVSLLLNCVGFVVEAVSSAETALARLQARQFDLLITDNLMPGMSGVELASATKLRSPGLPVIMFTGYPPPRTPPCLDLVLVKPSAGSMLVQSVRRFLQAS